MSCKINNLLFQLISCNECSSLIVILDNDGVHGSKLLASFIRSNASTLILLENKITRFYNPYSNLDISKVNVIDLFSELHSKELDLEYIKTISVQSTLVFIDSLVPLFFTFDDRYVYDLLEKISLKCNGLVTLTLSSLLNEIQISCLKEIATTIIELDSENCQGICKATITHKKRLRFGTKLIRELSYFKIQNNLDMIFIKTDQITKPSIPEEESSLLINSLPFNLSLKEEEKLSKDNLTLPYTKTSKVYYEPGEEDDVDEEDPDEDLLI